MCHLRGRLVMLENGLEGIIWNIEDISYRLKMEEALLKVKKLESIGRLAGGIAHDFNNILVAIIGNISLAERLMEENHKSRELLETALTASMRAKELTGKLLTFAGGGEPAKTSSSLPELLRESTSFALSGSNVKCEFSIPQIIWPINMDRGQIDQVIRNLVLNADQSMPNGGKITISCENVEAEDDDISGLKKGRYVRVTLQDTGTGIDRANLEKIFDPYFSTKEKDSIKGSGLGLSIVHSIIMKHNGLILVDSTPGEGTVFTLYLPALHEEEGVRIGGGDIVASGKGRILIMDDEKLIRDVLTEMLTYLGYTSIPSSDGQEAVNIYKESLSEDSSIAAVILDLTIPGGMGGEEAAQKILGLNPQAKIIVSSGYSYDPILDNYRDYGFCSTVSKPYQLLDLSRVLSTAISS